MIEDKLKNITIAIALFSVYFKNLKRNISNNPSISDDKKQIVLDKLESTSNNIEDFIKEIKKQTHLIELDTHRWLNPADVDEKTTKQQIRRNLEMESFFPKISSSVIDKDIQSIENMIKSCDTIGNLFHAISQQITNTKYMKYNTPLENLYNSFMGIYTDLNTLLKWYLRLKQII
jgi:hypothetical protein